MLKKKQKDKSIALNEELSKRVRIAKQKRKFLRARNGKRKSSQDWHLVTELAARSATDYRRISNSLDVDTFKISETKKQKEQKKKKKSCYSTRLRGRSKVSAWCRRFQRSITLLSLRDKQTNETKKKKEKKKKKEERKMSRCNKRFNVGSCIVHAGPQPASLIVQFIHAQNNVTCAETTC